MVTLAVNNVWTKISGIQDVKLVDDLDGLTSFYVAGYQYTKAFREGYFDRKTGSFNHWDGKKHLLTQKMVFPTGLLDRITGFLTERKVPYEIDDRRSPVTHGDVLEIRNYEPREYQKEAVETAITAGRGIIRVGTGGGKCLRIGTEVLKFDGTVCKVEDLVPGDLLMGPDSRPKTVLSKNMQFGDICRIVPKRGDSWFCNDVHILTLVNTSTGGIIDVPLDEYLTKTKKFKHLHKQFSVAVEFPPQPSLPVDPYFMGILFGDGDKTTKKGKLNSICITNIDPEVISFIHEFAAIHGKRLRVVKDKRSRSMRHHLIGFRKASERWLLNTIRSLLGCEVSIPDAYLTASRQDRLQFLAGLLDTDGYLHHNGYEICQKRPDYAKAICFLARSLGFKTISSEKYNKKLRRMYYRVGISGNVSEIPVKIARKKAQPRTQKKDACRTGFSIEKAGQDFYVGIELDGDGRFLLGDFTVTHNTLIAGMLAARYNVPTMIYVVGKDLLYQFHREIKKTLGVPIGLIGDGHCVIKQINVCSVWTAITAFGLKAQVSLDDEDWNPEVTEIGAKEKMAIKTAVERTNLAVFDEAHFLATDTLQSIFKAGKNCRYLFGLSGTDWRDDGADLLLESVCGSRIYNMPSSNLIRLGFLVPPKIVLYETPPLEEASSKNYASVYSKYVVHNPVRNGMVVDTARMLINKGRKVLILVRYLNHGRELASMLSDIPLYFVNGEVDGVTREEVKRSFEGGDLKCLIASSVFDIGVDLPSLDALILAGGGKSTVRTLQRIGRVIRACENKADAYVVDFIDNARYLDKHSAARITVYETEPAFMIKFPKDFDQTSIKRIKKINERLS